jgi:hypothetical protein
MSKIGRTTAASAALAIALLLSATAAQAQPGGPPPPPPPGGGGGYYPPPPPPPVWERRGLALGFGIGLGGMSDSQGAIGCSQCEANPASVGLDFHIGAMINPKLALLFEFWGQGQALDGTTTLVQSMGMIAAQYWVTPQLWLKGGLGVSNLSVSIDDGFNDPGSEEIDNGGAVMGAIGYELLSSPRFAIDLQGRFGMGTYDGIDEQIETGMIALGFNWY